MGLGNYLRTHALEAGISLMAALLPLGACRSKCNSTVLQPVQLITYTAGEDGILVGDIYNPEIKNPKGNFVQHTDRIDKLILTDPHDHRATFEFDPYELLRGVNPGQDMHPFRVLRKGEKVCTIDFDDDQSVGGQKGPPCGQLLLKGKMEGGEMFYKSGVVVPEGKEGEIDIIYLEPGKNFQLSDSKR